MGDIADVYESTRKELAGFVSTLSQEQLGTRIPATPDWTIHDVIAHLSGDVVCSVAGDFPREFFESFGSDEGIVKLNVWTDRMVQERRGRPLQDILDEWEEATPALMAMVRGETPWPHEIMAYAGHILIADIATHQQDIYGSLGLERDRRSPAVRIGLSTFVAGMGLRLLARGNGAAVRLVMEDKDAVCGEGEPKATVTADRFEFFRALSGRRNPDQIRSYEWDGDPEPFIPFFYPYGIRADALVE